MKELNSLPELNARRPKSRRKGLLLLAGGALVVAGVVLGIIPIIPGTPLVLLGVGLVATHSVRGRWLRWRVTAWLRRRGMRVPHRLGGPKPDRDPRTSPKRVVSAS